MEFKSNEIKTGLIIAASVIILGIFMTVIFGLKVGDKTHEYRVYLDYVGGITKGSLVKYRGLNVGQVSEILLPDDSRPRLGLTLQLNQDTPVRVDSRAFITSIGIMSEQHVEVSAGSPSAALLPPGSEIESKEVLSFARMSETMGELTEQAQTLIARVNAILSEKNSARLASIMENLDTAIQDGRRPAVETVKTLQAMSAQLDAIGKNIAAMTDTSRGDMKDIMGNLGQTTRNAQVLVEDMNATLKTLQMTIAANNANISDIMDNFQRVSRNFEEFSQMIKEQPWLLVRKAAPPQRKQ